MSSINISIHGSSYELENSEEGITITAKKHAEKVKAECDEEYKKGGMFELLEKNEELTIGETYEYYVDKIKKALSENIDYSTIIVLKWQAKGNKMLIKRKDAKVRNILKRFFAKNKLSKNGLRFILKNAYMQSPNGNPYVADIMQDDNLRVRLHDNSFVSIQEDNGSHINLKKVFEIHITSKKERSLLHYAIRDAAIYNF